ncbi:MAG: lipoate--protein ligase [Lachnospiraceae bacterium]|nr:lipoate--protein ligase [Lachnospiraceae bacterium]
MSKNLFYLETGCTDPFYNLAFEEYVLRNRKDGDYLILWQNQNTIVIGVNQVTQAEINTLWVNENSVNVVRRITGGGAVYHDLGNLNYSFITDYDSSEQLSMERFTRPVVAALIKLGIPAYASGKNDILANGRKLSGTAQKIIGGRILHHGTLLFDSDLSAVQSALNVDPEKFTGKGMKSVRSRICNIRQMLKDDMELPEFWGHIKKELSNENYVTGKLDEDELKAVLLLKESKYDTPEWNYGRSPDAGLHIKRRFPGGTIEIALSLSGNHVSSISFFGDFMARKPVDDICSALEGALFDEDTFIDILSQFQLADYFGGITSDQITDMLFYSSST